MSEETQTQETEYAEAWRPNVGDTILGRLVDVKMIDPGGNGPYPCVTLQTLAGEKAVHAFHTVLRRELARSRPKNGDEISITYLGPKDGGKNGTYHAYRVRGGQGQEFNWDAELPAEERQGAQQQEIPIDPAPIPQPVGTAAAQRQQQRNEGTAQAAEDAFGSEPPF